MAHSHFCQCVMSTGELYPSGGGVRVPAVAPPEVQPPLRGLKQLPVLRQPAAEPVRPDRGHAQDQGAGI